MEPWSKLLKKGFIHGLHGIFTIGIDGGLTMAQTEQDPTLFTQYNLDMRQEGSQEYGPFGVTPMVVYLLCQV